MRCESFRDAISARLDGEATGVDDDLLDRHLASCATCRAFAAQAQRLHGRWRLQDAAQVPDLSAPILAALEAEPAPAGRRQRGLRWALALTGVAQLLAGLPVLVLGRVGGVDAHLARDLGAFDVALAVGFLVAAWRPRRAIGLLPTALALAAATVAAIALDATTSGLVALTESAHLLDVIGLTLLWALVRAVPDASEAASAPPHVPLHT